MSWVRVMVTRLDCEPSNVGSNPTPLAKSLSQSLSMARISFPSSSPCVLILTKKYSPIVQSVERRTVNPYVTGSSPVRGA